MNEQNVNEGEVLETLENSSEVVGAKKGFVAKAIAKIKKPGKKVVVTIVTVAVAIGTISYVVAKAMSKDSNDIYEENDDENDENESEVEEN